jgi:hypothetical protein
MHVTFRVGGRDHAISDEEAGWLLGEIRLVRTIDKAGASVAAKIEEALEGGSTIALTSAEKRELLDALDRGRARPRSDEFRLLEIDLLAQAPRRTRLSRSSVMRCLEPSSPLGLGRGQRFVASPVRARATRLRERHPIRLLGAAPKMA